MLREGRQTGRIILVAQIAAVMNDPKKIMLRMVPLHAARFPFLLVYHLVVL